MVIRKINAQVWMSHADTIVKIPDNFEITAGTEDVEVGAYKLKDEQTYGLQFRILYRIKQI